MDTNYQSNISLSELELLSPELIFNILLGLPFQDILRFCRVSTRLSVFCNDWGFWAIKAEQDFEFPIFMFEQTNLEDPRKQYLEIQRYQKDLNRAVDKATLADDVNLIKYLVYRGADRLFRPLYAAAMENNLDLVDYIISAQRYRNQRTIGLDSALLTAAQKGYLDLVKYLVAQGAPRLDQALADAAAYGQLDIIRYLLSLPQLIQQGDLPLNKALIQAVYSDHFDVIKYLVEHGANDFEYALIRAKQKRYQDIEDYLISVIQERQ